MLPGPGAVGGAAHGSAGGGGTLGDVIASLGASGRGVFAKAGFGGKPSDGAGSMLPSEKAAGGTSPPNAGGGSSEGDDDDGGVSRGGARSASGAGSIGRCASGRGGNPNDGIGVEGGTGEGDDDDGDIR